MVRPMFGALGAGAVLGASYWDESEPCPRTDSSAPPACCTPRRWRAHPDPSLSAALVTLVANGLAWIAMTSTLKAEMQLVLPGLGASSRPGHLCRDFMGSQATGALLWGVRR